MKIEIVKIPSEGVELAGLRYIPDQATQSTALIYAHGFTSGKYSMDGLASYLAARGYEGLTFDFIGHKLGASGGEMRSVRQAVINLRDVLAWLRCNTEAKKIVLVGHSMGAAAGLNAVVLERKTYRRPDTPELVGIVCLCIGLDPSRGFESTIGRAMLRQRMDYVVGAPAAQLVSEVDGLTKAAGAVGSLPALFVAAKQDVLIPTDRVAALATLVGPTATVKIIESAHLDGPDRAKTVVVQWLEEHGF